MSTLEHKYKKIGQWFLIAGIIIFCILLKSDISRMLAVMLILLLLLSIFFVLYHSLLLFRLLPGKVATRPLLIGVFFIIGGALFDILMTVFHSPDLSEEGNPVALMLFNLETPLWGTYLILFFIQVCIVGSTIMLWASFLKNYLTIIKMIPYKNLFTTCRWLFGCGQMSFLDFMLNRNLNYFFFISTCTILLILCTVNRWYFAMEWLHLVPLSRTIPTAIIGVLFAFFLIKTHGKIKKSLKIDNNV